MKKLEYTSEKDFVTRTVEFPDEFYELATELKTLADSKFLTVPESPMVRSDEISLCFFIKHSKDTLNVEQHTGMYRITIEKIA